LGLNVEKLQNKFDEINKIVKSIPTEGSEADERLKWDQDATIQHIFKSMTGIRPNDEKTLKEELKKKSKNFWITDEVDWWGEGDALVMRSHPNTSSRIFSPPRVRISYVSPYGMPYVSRVIVCVRVIEATPV
jgi:hypothetical protein